jgi:hypothetical protein
MLVLVGGKKPRCPPVLAGVDPVQKQALGLLTPFPGLFEPDCWTRALIALI